MSGGLIDLVAKGIEDIFLINNAQITFFKTIYRRYTNFSIEPIPVPFINKPNFGKKTSCIILKNGDLIRKMQLVITLPSIPLFKDENGALDVINKFAWVRKIGFALIKKIEIIINEELIDCQYGDWLNIWNELTVTSKKDQ